MAGVLAARKVSALVFRGHEGLDELAANGPADLWWVREGGVEQLVLDPVADLGLAPVNLADLRGADPAFNADVVRRVLAGEQGPVRETVLLNAAAALVADGSLPGTGQGDLPTRLRAGLGHATAAVDDGGAAGVLERWIAASRS
jgi:anthranilate phosphoribosyltransferase